MTLQSEGKCLEQQHQLGQDPIISYLMEPREVIILVHNQVLPCIIKLINMRLDYNVIN